jgi:hypothetical protein
MTQVTETWLSKEADSVTIGCQVHYDYIWARAPTRPTFRSPRPDWRVF